MKKLTMSLLATIGLLFCLSANAADANSTTLVFNKFNQGFPQDKTVDSLANTKMNLTCSVAPGSLMPLAYQIHITTVYTASVGTGGDMVLTYYHPTWTVQFMTSPSGTWLLQGRGFHNTKDTLVKVNCFWGPAPYLNASTKKHR